MNTKIINVNLTKVIKIKKDYDESILNDIREHSTIQKTPKKRIVTETKKWIFGSDELTYEKQKEYISQIKKCTIAPNNEATCKFILQQINQKIYGYGRQDLKKCKYNESQAIDAAGVFELMVDCNNQCFYCKENVQVLYENVREPKQWTLDRLDNAFGHNKTNVVIACLNCNLRRKTMYHERFVFTKQLNIIK